MKVDYRIAQMSDLEAIYQFSEEKLKELVPDDTERMMKIWDSRFRKEALEHYLKLGWSFVAEDDNQRIQGYFLGQPLLFFEGNTQTLWVEHIQASQENIAADLVEISYKLSREKHFQKVILPQSAFSILDLKDIKYQKQSDSWIWCKTTK